MGGKSRRTATRKTVIQLYLLMLFTRITDLLEYFVLKIQLSISDFRDDFSLTIVFLVVFSDISDSVVFIAIWYLDCYRHYSSGNRTKI